MAKFVVSVEVTVEDVDEDAAENQVAEALKAFDHELGETEEEDYDLSDEQVVELFRAEYLPEVIKQYGADDEVAIRTSFNDFVDSLSKDNLVTEWQADNMDNPF